MDALRTGAPPGNDNAVRGHGVVGKTDNYQQVGFCYPAPASVKGRVLADLLAGDKMTHLDVWERHGSSRAAHHILMLRKAGWPVITKEIEVPTSDGRRALIAEYSMPSMTIDAAGDIGRRYVSEVLVIRRAS